ncbi:hypothetical protein QYM36_015117, partial [Artemia franciscana]
MDFSAILSRKFRIPEGLTEYMELLAKEIIRYQPENLHIFAAQFFGSLVEEQE